jgi:hypothetical protein
VTSEPVGRLTRRTAVRLRFIPALAVLSVGLSGCGLFGDDRFDFDDSWLPVGAPTMDDCPYGFGDGGSSGGMGSELSAVDQWIPVDGHLPTRTVRVEPVDVPFLEAATANGYELTLAVFDGPRNEHPKDLLAAVASTPEGVHYFATQCGARNSLWLHERLGPIYDERIAQLVGETRDRTMEALLSPRSPFEIAEPPGTIGEEVGGDDAYEVGLIVLRPEGHLGDRQICSSVTRGLGECAPLSQLRDRPWLRLDAWFTDRMDENSYLDVVPPTGYPATGSFGTIGIRHWQAFERAEANGGGVLVLDLGGRIRRDGLVVGGTPTRVLDVLSADRLERHPELLDQWP